MGHLRAVIEKIVRSMAVLSALGACVLVFAISYDVFSRQFLGGSVPGLLELNETLLVWIVFMGIPYAEQAGAHVRMTLVSDRVPRVAARIMRSVAYVLSSGLIAWMAYSSVLRAADSFGTGEAKQGLMQWPLWPARVVLAAGLIVLLLQCLLHVYDALRDRGMFAQKHDGEPAGVIL